MIDSGCNGRRSDGTVEYMNSSYHEGNIRVCIDRYSCVPLTVQIWGSISLIGSSMLKLRLHMFFLH